MEVEFIDGPWAGQRLDVQVLGPTTDIVGVARMDGGTIVEGWQSGGKLGADQYKREAGNRYRYIGWKCCE